MDFPDRAGRVLARKFRVAYCSTGIPSGPGHQMTCTGTSLLSCDHHNACWAKTNIQQTQKPIFFFQLFPFFLVTTLIMQWMMAWRRWLWCDDNYDEHDGNIDDNCDDNGDNDDDRVEGANMQAATSSHLQSRLHNLQYFISIIFIILILLSDRVITIFIIKKTESFSSDDHRYDRKTQPEDFNEPFCYFTWVYICITLVW